jgi:hypothetical protein
VTGYAEHVTEQTVLTEAPEVPAPPEIYPLAEGIEAVWCDTHAVIRFESEVMVGTDDTGSPLFSVEMISHLTRAGSMIRKTNAFEEAWKAWHNHPGRFGAICRVGTYTGHTSEGLPALTGYHWFAPESVTAGTKPEFGTPYLAFAQNEWRVHLTGLNPYLATIAWDDESGLPPIIETLAQCDYWQAIAALREPRAWANAQATERRRLSQLRTAEQRLNQNAQAAREFAATPDLSIRTRALARLLRQFPWNSYASSRVDRPRLLSGVRLIHCDLPNDGAAATRAAECLEIEWTHSITKMQIREVAAELTEHLAPHGYSIVTTQSKRIFIARDDTLLRTHLAALSRHRLDKPFLEIY